MKIKWCGPERFVPPYGLMRKGDVRTVDEKHAESLVKQGLAKYHKVKEVYDVRATD